MAVVAPSPSRWRRARPTHCRWGRGCWTARRAGMGGWRPRPCLRHLPRPDLGPRRPTGHPAKAHRRAGRLPALDLRQPALGREPLGATERVAGGCNPPRENRQVLPRRPLLRRHLRLAQGLTGSNAGRLRKNEQTVLPRLDPGCSDPLRPLARLRTASRAARSLPPVDGGRNRSEPWDSTMDQDTLVAGGAEGLRAANFPVEAICLIKRTSVDDEIDWVIPVVLSPFILGSDRDLIYEVARLRLCETDGRAADQYSKCPL